MFFFCFSSLLKLRTHRRSHTNRPKQPCHKPCERVPLPPDAYLTWTCVTAGSPICPHVFGFHSYLTAVNKQFMPFNLGNTLHPDTRWRNHLDFLSLSASSYGKENSWRSSTDNTEAHYLLRALQGCFWNLKGSVRPLSGWPGIQYWITARGSNEIWLACSWWNMNNAALQWDCRNNHHHISQICNRLCRDCVYLMSILIICYHVILILSVSKANKIDTTCLENTCQGCVKSPDERGF